ncbi:exopolysaccharide biosynthesis polyprenyl glycosylphosphotransferase [Zafaria cholistanensis]|uniref:Exopolysaccharide biosynthesis polyprenyl glycosylphosphotransferase n=1 Tax=Zafaria cholistanensis TaxID=1682741 RepID=A0A5A7NSB3_9MICC|nr:sugar transferase [Zafaria cholistanensis]GER22688.1 exopolysaccharide biosynthesis polyprenyl glycosylphosphotransferase [Zafaria cholistanensis]
MTQTREHVKAHPAVAGFNRWTGPGILEAGTPEDPGTKARTSGEWRRRYQLNLLASDGLVIMASVLLVLFMDGTDTWPAALAVASSWILLLSLFRAHCPRYAGVGATEYKRIIDATAATAGWLAVVDIAFGFQALRDFLVLSLPLGAALLLATRWVWRHRLLTTHAEGQALFNVLVVGQPADIAYVVTQLEKKSGPAYRVVGVVLEHEEGPEVSRPGRGRLPVLRGLSTLEAAIQRYSADAVIVAGQLDAGSSYITQLGWRLERTGTELILASSLTNVAGPRIHVRPFEGLPLMHVETPTFDGGKFAVKRALDVVASGLGLLVLAPVLAAVALLIVLDSPGGPVFRQQRVGRDGRTFTMYKFRTMCTDAERELERLAHLNEGSGPLFKLRHDPRITRVGAWLRKFSLDEFPQLLNVLRGDMSLVGPRPPLPQEVESYDGHEHRRLLTKPGLTGLWQVSGRSDLDWEESVRLDLYYVENWSLTGDLQILWRTVKVVLKPVGAY